MAQMTECPHDSGVRCAVGEYDCKKCQVYIDLQPKEEAKEQPKKKRNG